MKPIKKIFYLAGTKNALFKEVQIEVFDCKISETNLKISEYVFNSNNILLEITHNKMNTLIDFKGASDYRVLFLDENHFVTGGTYAKNNSKGYMIQTQSKKILLTTLKPILEKSIDIDIFEESLNNRQPTKLLSMKKFIFGILRVYICLIVWIPSIWVLWNVEDGTFFYLFMLIITFLLGTGTIIYITQYYKTDRDTDS